MGGRSAVYNDDEPLMCGSFWPFDGCSSWCEAVEVLLTTQVLNGRRITLGEGVPLNRHEPHIVVVGTKGSSRIAACHTISLPDNPPVRGSPPITNVHRIALMPDVAARINAQLCDAARQKVCCKRDSGVLVSNVGGFHSTETLITAVGRSLSEWMGEDLPGLCFEALAIIREDALSSYDLTGWLNASHETDFNILHDHGSAAWSLVYFASSGRGAGSEDLSNWNSHDLLGGELLLKTQLQPFTHRYAYLPIRPDPGVLWMFPGYLPHAVLPRRLQTPEEGLHTGTLRVSAAFNATVKSQLI